MPGLQSFCVTVSLCLGSIYLLMLTWFVACLTLDQRRVEQRRNGLIPCIVHKSKDDTTERWGDKVLEEIWGTYRKLLSSTVLRIFVIISCLTCLGFGVHGWISINQVFDALKMLPSGSYLTHFHSIYDKDYPKDGWIADVYSGKVGAEDLENIDKLISGLKDLEHQKMYIKGEVNISISYF